MEESDDVASSGHGCEDCIADDIICSPPSAGGVAAVQLFSCRGGDDLAVREDILSFFSDSVSRRFFGEAD
jgi:hypothetical protein